jgi:hypothetical protein
MELVIDIQSTALIIVCLIISIAYVDKSWSIVREGWQEVLLVCGFALSVVVIIIAALIRIWG